MNYVDENQKKREKDEAIRRKRIDGDNEKISEKIRKGEIKVHSCINPFSGIFTC